MPFLREYATVWPCAKVNNACHPAIVLFEPADPPNKAQLLKVIEMFCHGSHATAGLHGEGSSTAETATKIVGVSGKRHEKTSRLTFNLGRRTSPSRSFYENKCFGVVSGAMLG